MRRTMWTLAAAMLVTTACTDEGPTVPYGGEDLPEPPSLAVTQEFQDREGVIFFNGCTGEWVLFAAGSVEHVVTSSKDDGAGGFHVRVHRNGQHYNGSGLEWNGVEFVATGTEYVGNATLNYSLNVKPPFPAEYTFTQNVRVMQKGSGGKMLFHVVDHITVNANGDVTADVLDVWAECL